METSKVKNLTALILTYNEENNIKRVLDELQWLEKVVILDSYSTDQTIAIIKSYPNTEVFYRKFDTHATQWNYGLTLVATEWVLTLDADYVLTPGFIRETKSLISGLNDDVVAYYTRFRFVVFGRPLLRDNTTQRPVLFRRNKCTYYDDGHTQRLFISGKSGNFSNVILHDDRKPLSRWLSNLDNYSIKECQKLTDSKIQSERSFVIKVRKTKVLSPFLVFFYCLFVNGSILDGWRGWHYTIQRTMVEMLFTLRLIEKEKFEDVRD